MRKITVNDLSELRIEIMSCFIYLAESQLKQKLNIDLLKDQHQLGLLMEDCRDRKIYGYPVEELYQAQERIFTFIHLFASIPQKAIDAEYQQILNAYIDVGVPIYGFNNPKLKNRINGVKNIKKRYENNLYEKREILYKILRDTARQQGKWSGVSQAVNDVYPQLEQAFHQFNEQWIRNKMKELKETIKQNEKGLKNNIKPDFNNGRIQFQDRGFQNKIIQCQKEYEKLEKALKSGNVNDVLGRTLAFHSVYQEETIINHIRSCPELMSEIIEIKSKK